VARFCCSRRRSSHGRRNSARTAPARSSSTCGLLIPHLGADQAALAHDDELTYTKDAAEAAALVADGSIAAALILRGIPKPDIADVSAMRA